MGMQQPQNRAEAWALIDEYQAVAKEVKKSAGRSTGFVTAAGDVEVTGDLSGKSIFDRYADLQDQIHESSLAKHLAEANGIYIGIRDEQELAEEKERFQWYQGLRAEHNEAHLKALQIIKRHKLSSGIVQVKDFTVDELTDLKHATRLFDWVQKFKAELRQPAGHPGFKSSGEYVRRTASQVERALTFRGFDIGEGGQRGPVPGYDAAETAPRMM